MELIGRLTLIMLSLLNAVNAHPHCRLIHQQWGLIVGSDKLVNIPTNITIKQLLYCNACDGISSFENDGIGYFLGVADVTPTNIIFRFKENPQTFRWFILSK